MRLSPTRAVTRRWSKNSRSGMAYFREIPSKSLMSLGPISLRSRRSATSFVWIESSACAATKLLAGHSWLERVRAMERRQLVDDQPAQAREAVGMDEPVTIDADHPAGRLKTFEEAAKAFGSERYAPREGRQTHPTGADVTDVLFQHDLRASRLEQLQMGDERRPLPLEARRIHVEQGSATDRHDRRVRAHDEAVSWPR